MAFAAFAGVLGLERRRPLRRRVEPGADRIGRNLAVAAASALALQLTEKPIVARLARTVARRRWGLVQRMPLPDGVKTVLALLLLDYSLYVWHVLLHRVHGLWRFHVVHHADLDLDATTALRFHAGELVASVPWRAAQILLIGVTPRALRLWQTATLASVVFHHSNIRLPVEWERRLAWVLVTPRMHGIHHSVVEAETDSNWSSGLTIWDRLHRTLRLDLPQGAITIGVPAYRDRESLVLSRMLALPFTSQGQCWCWPDGTRPVRAEADAPADRPAFPEPLG
jgi:sterol desaturase/sphingolipid hydroxylase (fatty acid hydroxylase superfamily)